MIRTTFVGESREQLVRHLVEQFELCKKLGRAHWVSLEGPSGWGKTRVVQEFYKCLSVNQVEPAYWPPEMVRFAEMVSGGPQIEVSRKTVSPHVRHVPDSLPTYMWWGTSCSSRNGVSSDALAEDLKEFENHALYYHDAWLNAQGLPARIAAVAGATAKQAASDSVEGLLDSGLGDAFLPGFSFLHTTGARALNGLRASRDRSERRESDMAIEPALDIVDETFALISRLVGATLPLVLVVDDIHRIDEGLARLLQKLVALDAPVFIVSTALPGLIENNSWAWTLFEGWWQERLDRIVHTDDVSPQGGLDQLSLDDRTSLVRDYFPRARPASQRLIAGRYENPLALELFCRIDRVRRELEDTGTIAELVVSETPTTVKDLYRELWLDLPAGVRAILSMAARSVPAQIDGEWGRSNRWHYDIIRRSIEVYFSESDRRRIFGDTLADDSRFAWTRMISENLREFVESDEQAVAAYDDDILGRSDTDVFLNVLANLLLPYEIGSDEEDLHLAWLALSLRGAGANVSDEVMASSSLVLLVHLDRYPQELRTRIAIAEFALAECGPVVDLTPHIRLLLGKALHETGRLEEAHQVFTALIDDRKSGAFALPDGLWFSLRVETAFNFLRMGKTMQAVTMLEELVAETEDYFEDETAIDRRAEVRIHYANALVQTGQYEVAIDTLNSLSEDRRHPISEGGRISATSIKASALQAAGRFVESIALHRDLVREASRLYAEEDPFTMTMANNLATALHKGGHLEEAIGLFEEVSRKRNLLLGPNHPAALVVRNNKANALKDANRFDEAQAEFEALISDQLRLLGPDHPSLLLARHNLALVFEARGDKPRAMEIYKQVLEDRQRVLSPNHLALFVSKFTLARALLEDKQFEAATGLWEELLAAQRETLGDADGDTMATWRYTVISLVNAGRTAKGLKLAEKLVQVVRAKNGSNHLLTMQAEVEVAIVLSSSGRRREALRKLSTVRARAVHFLGSGHDFIRILDSVVELAEVQQRRR